MSVWHSVDMEQNELTEAWHSYKFEGNMVSRNLLAEHYQPVVRYVASKVGQGLPSMVERDDLISYGNFGLLDAIKKFDLEKGVKFETYAVSRIRGAIIDELRALDWVPRTIRAKARDVERAVAELQNTLGRAPQDDELALHLGLEIKDLWAIQSQQAMTYVSDYHWHDDSGVDNSHQDESRSMPIDRGSNPEDLYMPQELGRLLADAIDGMTGRAKVVLSLYYCQEMTLAEIATVLGVTVSRVCQIQSKILQQLREELGHGAAQMVA